MGTSYGNRTSPVLRGAWILENITGTPPNSPPPGVEAFKEAEPGKKVDDRARAARAASRESLLQCLPWRDGSAGLRARELRCGGRLARPGPAMPARAIDSSGKLASGTQVERAGAAAQGAARAAGSVRADPHRKAHDLRARTQPALPGHAHGARHRAAGCDAGKYRSRRSSRVSWTARRSRCVKSTPPRQQAPRRTRHTGSPLQGPDSPTARASRR